MTNHQGLNIKTVQIQFKILSLQNSCDHAKLFQKTNLAQNMDCSDFNSEILLNQLANLQ